MKRFLLIAIMVCAAAVSAFAQSYTVQSVTGRVQREAGSGRVDVKSGDVLAADIIVHTGIGSTLVLKDGDKTLTVPAARSGKVAELAAAASGVRIGGNVIRTDTSEMKRSTGQVSTASARASDAAADEDIVAE